jgi:uncharacterized OB-fold protein
MTDPIADWLAAAADRRLVVQRCARCGHHQHYPRYICTQCGEQQLEFVPVAGKGAVWSFTEVHRAPAPDMDTPYTVALVRLDEGPVLLTHLVYPDPVCDDRVQVEWSQRGDASALPVFGREA